MSALAPGRARRASPSPAATAIVYAATRDGDETRRSRRRTSWAALAPSPLAAHRGRRARVGDRDLRRRRFVVDRRHHRRAGRYDISEDSWSRAQHCRSASTIRASPRTTAGLRARRQPRRRCREQVETPLPLRARAATAGTGSPDAPTARAALGARRPSAAASTPPAATARRTRTCSALEIYDVKRDRWTARADDADRPQPRRGRGARGRSRGDRRAARAPSHGGLATVERYDPEAQPLVIAAAD